MKNSFHKPTHERSSLEHCQKESRVRSWTKYSEATQVSVQHYSLRAHLQTERCPWKWVAHKNDLNHGSTEVIQILIFRLLLP